MRFTADKGAYWNLLFFPVVALFGYFYVEAFAGPDYGAWLPIAPFSPNSPSPTGRIVAEISLNLLLLIWMAVLLKKSNRDARIASLVGSILAYIAESISMAMKTWSYCDGRFPPSPIVFMAYMIWFLILLRLYARTEGVCDEDRRYHVEVPVRKISGGLEICLFLSWMFLCLTATAFRRIMSDDLPLLAALLLTLLAYWFAAATKEERAIIGYAFILGLLAETIGTNVGLWTNVVEGHPGAWPSLAYAWLAVFSLRITPRFGSRKEKNDRTIS